MEACMQAPGLSGASMTQRLSRQSVEKGSEIGHLGAFSIAPGLPGTLEQNKGIARREHKTAMFGITRETLRQFSLGEILLLIAMNLETGRLASENRVRLANGAALSS
jgi:hypothetical protein